MALSAQQTADVSAQFEPARKRASQQEATNLQGQKDALARRAAQLGGGPSGAFIKQESMAADESAKRLQDANEGINAAQTGALNQAREVQAGREFQTSERLGSQGFAGEQSALARRFQTGEREASQAYGTGEREAGQQFASGEAATGRQFASEEAGKSRASAHDEAYWAREAAREMNDKNRDFEYQKFGHEQAVDQYNMDLGQRMLGQKDGIDTLFNNISVRNIGRTLGGGGGWRR